MKLVGRKTAYQGVPRSHAFFRPILWFVWAVATLAVCGAAASTFSLRTQAAETSSFLGTLRRETELIEVNVPRYAVISNVVIGRGDTVAKGQTVATLNAPAMQDAYDRISAELRVLSYELKCLNSYHPPDLLAVQAANELAELQVAAADCHAEHRNAKNDLDVLMTRQRLLREQRAIINGYLAMHVEAYRKPFQNASKRKLDLLLLRNQIDRGLADLRQKKALHFAELSAHRNRRARALVGSISDLASKQAQVAALIKVPRLRMPETGTVRRIRQLGFKGPSFQEFTLIEATTFSDTQYHVTFQAEPRDVPKLETARGVLIEIHGLANRRRQLRGDIVHFLSGDADHVVVKVSLDASSIEILNDPESGLAFTGEGSLSRVTVTQMPVSIANHILALATPAVNALSSNHAALGLLLNR